MTRRTFLTAMAVSLLGLAAGSALAAPTTVEIVAMAHPPVKAALAPLRQWLAAQGGKVKRRTVKVAFETDTAALIASGLKANEVVVVQGMVGLADDSAIRTSE